MESSNKHCCTMQPSRPKDGFPGKLRVEEPRVRATATLSQYERPIWLNPAQRRTNELPEAQGHDVVQHSESEEPVPSAAAIGRESGPARAGGQHGTWSDSGRTQGEKERRRKNGIDGYPGGPAAFSRSRIDRQLMRWPSISMPASRTVDGSDSQRTHLGAHPTTFSTTSVGRALGSWPHVRRKTVRTCRFFLANETC